jgi:hypothetical protein
LTGRIFFSSQLNHIEANISATPEFAKAIDEAACHDNKSADASSPPMTTTLDLSVLDICFSSQSTNDISQVINCATANGYCKNSFPETMPCSSYLWHSFSSLLHKFRQTTIMLRISI